MCGRLSVLKLDALVRTLEVDVQGLAQPVRIVPHAAEHGKLHDLFLAEVLLHRRESGIVVARREQRDGFGPADRRLLPVVERSEERRVGKECRSRWETAS